MLIGNENISVVIGASTELDLKKDSIRAYDAPTAKIVDRMLSQIQRRILTRKNLFFLGFFASKSPNTITPRVANADSHRERSKTAYGSNIRIITTDSGKVV